MAFPRGPRIAPLEDHQHGVTCMYTAPTRRFFPELVEGKLELPAACSAKQDLPVDLHVQLIAHLLPGTGQ